MSSKKLHCEVIPQDEGGYKYGFPPFCHLTFGKRHFSTDISSTGYFGRCMFRPCRHTGTWTFHRHGHFDTRTFQHEDILAKGIFNAMDISAWDISATEHFSIWIFWHLEKQYKRFSTDTSAPVLLCQNVHVPKCPRAEMSVVHSVVVSL